MQALKLMKKIFFGKSISDHHGLKSKLSDPEKNSSLEEPNRSGTYIKSLVYGGLDGILEMFAVICGVNGSGMNVGIILVLGAATLLADALSMGLGDYLSEKAEMQYEHNERKREEAELIENRKTKMQNVVENFQRKGMTVEKATQAVELISSSDEAFLEVMMALELGVLPRDPSESAVKNGIVTSCSFIGFGLIPFLVYLIGVVATSLHHVQGTRETDILFFICVHVTLLTLFALGAISSRFTGQKWWSAGGVIMVNGALAAAVSYFIGWSVNNIFGIIPTHA